MSESEAGVREGQSAVTPLTASPDLLRDEVVTWPSRRVRTTKGVLMDFVVDEVDLPGGGTMVRNYLEHPSSVSIIAMDDRDRIAIEWQYRHPVRRRLLEAPAGLRDQPGEDPLAAAKRELAEELGLAAATWSILADTYSTPGCSTQATRIFLARNLSRVERPDGFRLEAEEADMKTGWAHLEDLVDAVFAGQVMNPTIVTGVLALKAAMASGMLDTLRLP